MSGVVNNLKNAGNTVVNDVKNIGTDVVHGQVLKGVGDIVGTAVDVGASVVSGGQLTDTVHGATHPGDKGIVGGAAAGFNESGGLGQALMGQPAQVPNIAIQDPTAVAAQQTAQRAAAVRQAQIDQQTNMPGRGGTILTNNYQYRT